MSWINVLTPGVEKEHMPPPCLPDLLGTPPPTRGVEQGSISLTRSKDRGTAGVPQPRPFLVQIARTLSPYLTPRSPLSLALTWARNRDPERVCGEGCPGIEETVCNCGCSLPTRAVCDTPTHNPVGWFDCIGCMNDFGYDGLCWVCSLVMGGPRAAPCSTARGVPLPHGSNLRSPGSLVPHRWLQGLVRYVLPCRGLVGIAVPPPPPCVPAVSDGE